MYVKIEDTIPEEEEEDMLDTLIHNRYNKQLYIQLGQLRLNPPRTWLKVR